MDTGRTRQRQLKVPEVARTVVINDRAEARGGATSLALLSAQWLQAAGTPVTFISGDAGDPVALREAGVEHVSLEARPLSAESRKTDALSALWKWRTKERLERWIALHDEPDTIYHLHGWQKVLSPSVFSALSRVRGRIIVHAHDFFLACPNGAYMNYSRGEVCALRPLSMDCLATRCDRRSQAHKLYRVARQYVQNGAADLRRSQIEILLIHEGMRGPLQRAGIPGDRMHTLPNPCLPLSEQPVTAAENRTFFFVGRLDEEKGALDLARAARAAEVPVEMIGEGPLRTTLENEFPEVVLHGWRSRSEIARIVRRARCVVMPSRYPEPFGLVAVEALRSGLPVLLSQHALLAQDVEERGLGLGVDARDMSAFAAALRRLANDDELVSIMGSRAVTASRSLSTTPEQWSNALLAHYGRLRAKNENTALSSTGQVVR